MANIKSAQKADRQGQKRKVVNLARRSALKTTIKNLRNALDNPAKSGQASLDVLLKSVAAQLARAKSKKVIKKNTASRTLSRLACRVAAVQANHQ